MVRKTWKKMEKPYEIDKILLKEVYWLKELTGKIIKIL